MCEDREALSREVSPGVWMVPIGCDDGVMAYALEPRDGGAAPAVVVYDDGKGGYTMLRREAVSHPCCAEKRE